MPDWDLWYAEKAVQDAKASRVLTENAHLLPKSGVALDFACGLGGNSKYMAQRGCKVVALDKSGVAVEKLSQFAADKQLNINAICHDLEESVPAYQEEFDAIIVSYYLHRQSLPLIEKMLKKGGLLFYQTFSGPQLSGVGPSNPEYRLHRGELLEVYKNMELLVYHEAPFDDFENSMADQVLFVARK